MQNRLFTTEGKNPFDQVVWVKKQARISEGKEIIFKLDDVEAPESWSQLAIDMVASKYFRKVGVGTQGGGETSIRQLIWRVAHTLRLAGEKLKYFSTSKDADIFEDELIYILVNQIGAFNSPVWFNCGLSQTYGIKGRNVENYAWNSDTQAIEQTTDAYTHPQLSACFIQSLKDDLQDIAELVWKEMKVFKFGGGTGTNFSNLRAKGEPLTDGGSSTGLIRFLDIYDRTAGAIKSAGTTRRAAKMVVVDVDHPEILDFINWKVKEEEKARILIEKGGLSSDYRGEAYQTVSGQNSNNSVRVPNSFMHAVLNDESWETKWRLSGQTAATYKAKDIWDAIVKAARSCADPGIQFADTINSWNPCINSGKINSSNPCGEFQFLDNTACNLASVNLQKFLKRDNSFDVEKFKHTCSIFTLAQEIIVDYASYPTKEIALNSHNFRPLGLGYSNLGAVLMSMGLPYDSQEARGFAACVTAIMTGQAYLTSALIASKIGSFTKYQENIDPFKNVIRKHANAAQQLSNPCNKCPNELLGPAWKVWLDAIEAGDKYGYRNAQVTVLAPTGTISFMMDCTTTGIEPDFSLVKYKALAGGGSVMIVNSVISKALRRLGYDTNQIDRITNHILVTGTIEGSELKDEHLSIFDCANTCGEGVRSIHWQGHLLMMAACQPFLSGAISKTINLSSSATEEDVKEAYLEGWKFGLKAIALYVDGSKSSQPLSSAKEEVDPLEQMEKASCQKGICSL